MIHITIKGERDWFQNFFKVETTIPLTLRIFSAIVMSLLELYWCRQKQSRVSQFVYISWLLPRCEIIRLNQYHILQKHIGLYCT